MSRRPLPESVRQLARDRGFLPGRPALPRPVVAAPKPVWPLRGPDGRTFAERAADRARAAA